MKHKPIITLCSSTSFYKDVVRIEKELKQLGFRVKIPKTAIPMKRTGDYTVNNKTWLTNPNDYTIKTSLMNTHFKKIIASDAILVINGNKNGITGYIGGNVLLEMLIAYLHKKPIYILHPVGEYMLTEEVYGLKPIMLNGDLKEVRL